MAALTNRQRQLVIGAFRVEMQRNKLDQAGQLDLLFDLLLQPRPAQIAEARRWVANLRALNQANLDNLPAQTAESEAQLTTSLADLDATDAALAGP